MAFDPVVFGTYVVGTGFTDGSSILEGGFRLFIVPSENIGDAPLDVTVTYVDQFGNLAEQTTVSTSIEANTTASTHVQVSLNTGDTGIRDVTAVNVVGGTTGDTFTLESWHEGVGKTVTSLEKGERENNQQILDIRDVHPNRIKEQGDPFIIDCIHENVVYDPITKSFTLPIEEIEPNYSTEIDISDGLMPANITLDGTNKYFRVDLPAETSFVNVDSEYTNQEFEFDAKAFYKITFDYDVKLNSSYFIVELLDDQDNIKWSKNGTTIATGQIIDMLSTNFRFRVRCKADYVSPLIFSDYCQISNIKLERYKDTGLIQQSWHKHFDSMMSLETVNIDWTPSTAETAVKAQLNISDDNSSWTGWNGPNGTSGSYYTGNWQIIDKNGKIGKYWKANIWLESDGRHTPTFNYMEYYMYVRMKAIEKEFQDTDPTNVGVPVAFHPIYLPLQGQKADYQALPISGRDFVQRLIDMIATLEPADNQQRPTSGRILTEREILLFRSWAESVVGVVMSGYVKDQEDTVILNAVKVILESTYTFGKDTMGSVNPETGFFQIFVKDAKYDKRHLIVEVSGRSVNISLAEYGDPAILDATSGQVPNQDLHFWKSSICRSVAHVDSLVTY
ncbi:hypothetical protein [uncultured Methanolobus sp.]|uniref:hypothetical protein n=1 Tax=uncultured Methanolobus sp. TaxID=218300 RepID=UPI0029C9AA56|nr:hypothetical protein [uncultured Methanolobus sp.]